MAEEIDFENGRNSNFEGLVTLTLTFDPAIRHIVLQQSSTSTYIPTFIQIEETFCGRTDVRTYRRTYRRTDGRTYGRTDIIPLYTIRSTFGSQPKNEKRFYLVFHVISDNDADEQCETNHTANEDKQMNENSMCLTQHNNQSVDQSISQLSDQSYP